MPASRETRIIIITMLISGALAGMMALNPIMGDQHRVALDFVAGAGFVGIAVALMGRSHPVGIVLAAILFGMLYQGGAELAFEMPEITRDMIVIIQGLVILFAGALEHMFRPPIQALFASLQPALGRPGGGQRRGRLRWSSSTRSSRCSTRPSASRCRCCSPASPASIPSAPASSTSGSKARCWPAPSPAAPPPPSPARPGSASAAAILDLGRVGAGARLRLDHPSRQPDRLRRRHQLHRRRLDHHPRPGLVPAGRPHAGAARPATASSAITLPGADAVRDVPIIGPIYSELHLRPLDPRLSRLPGGAVHLVGAVPHPLRPAAARRRREPGRRRHRRHLGRLAALPRASSAPASSPASPAPICRSRRTPASSRT